MEDRVGALNQSLQRTVVEDDENDVIDNIAVADEEKMKEAVKEREMKEQQSNLFTGLKFFLGREVPREPLVFMIRAVGGEVSWDSSVGVGATFNQSDASITQQVIWCLEDSTFSHSGSLTVSTEGKSAERRIMP